MKLTGAQIIIQTLLEQGVTDVFGYPGGRVLAIYDELYRAAGKLRHIRTAHEQGAAHAADDYSRATGNVGVVIATSGPGATNLVTGIATAMLDSIPLVAITGNVPTHQIGTDAFQEVDITGITLPITKHNFFVTHISELADTIREAFQIAISGRPGPVLIDVPSDVQEAVCEYREKPLLPKLPQPRVPDADLRAAAEMIRQAKRPYLYIGGGAASAEIAELIQAFAEKIDAYIGCTFMGLNALPSSCPRFLGMQGLHGKYPSSMANRESDLILALGVRFSDRATGDPLSYGKQATIIHLDADLSEINKNIPASLGLVGDLKDTLSRLLEACAPADHPEWSARIHDLIRHGEQLEEGLSPETALTPRSIFRAINAEKSADTILVTDVGQHQMWTAQYAKFETPRSFLSSGGLGTMGFGLGAAIGAHIGSGREVMLITGDGSFGMNLNELATAVSANIPIVIVLLNNGTLGMVRQWQDLNYGKRYSQTIVEQNTDFVALARAFGAQGIRAETLEEFQTALKGALCAKRPFVIDAKIDAEEFVLPLF